MDLRTCQPVGFIPTQNPEAARTFFEHTLGLHFVADDGFAQVFRLGPPPGIQLRVIQAPAFTPLPFTLFGWEVPDLDATIATLTSRGVTLLRYPFLQHDEHGIWNAPGGTRVAWLHDPDGNTLSLAQHATSAGTSSTA